MTVSCNTTRTPGAMPIQQPNHLIPNPKPDVVRPPEPAQPPEPDVIRPPTPEETPEKDIPIGVPDQIPDLPPPEPPREIPRDRPPEVPPSPTSGRTERPMTRARRFSIIGGTMRGVGVSKVVAT